MLPRLLRLVRSRLGFVALEALLKFFQLLTESIRAIGELLGVVLLILRRIGLCRVGQLAIAIGDVLRFVLERLHSALERRALEHLTAFLELLTQTLLERLEVLERVLRLILREILRRVLELDRKST